MRYAAGVVTLALMAACLPATIALVDPPADDEPLAFAQPVAVQPAPLPAADQWPAGPAQAQLARVERERVAEDDPAGLGLEPSPSAQPIAAAGPTGGARRGR